MGALGRECNTGGGARLRRREEGEKRRTLTKRSADAQPVESALPSLISHGRHPGGLGDVSPRQPHAPPPRRDAACAVLGPVGNGGRGLLGVRLWKSTLRRRRLESAGRGVSVCPGLHPAQRQCPQRRQPRPDGVGGAADVSPGIRLQPHQLPQPGAPGPSHVEAMDAGGRRPAHRERFALRSRGHRARVALFRLDSQRLHLRAPPESRPQRRDLNPHRCR